MPGVRIIDKVMMSEYINLPGIISDRFMSLCSSNGKKNDKFEESAFIGTLLRLFSSSIEQKMEFTFQL